MFFIKKTRGVTILVSVVVFVLLCQTFSPVRAAEITLPGISIDSNMFTRYISDPFSRLVNSFKNTGVKIGPSSVPQKISAPSISPAEFFKRGDEWLKAKVGFGFIRILKFVGNIFASILSFAANLVRRGVSYL